MPWRPRVGACLQSLVREELIEPGHSEIRTEDAFRFTHILVRDAVYRLRGRKFGHGAPPEGTPDGRPALDDRPLLWLELVQPSG